VKLPIRVPRRSLVLRAAALLAIAPLAAAGAANAQTAALVGDPPLLVPRAGPAPAPALRTAQAAARAVPGVAPGAPFEVTFDLDVTYTANKIWNPATQRSDAVKLRSYQGPGVDPAAPYVSPTISVFPGQTIRFTLNNKLPPDASCIREGAVNIPHCFNGTNLHTHGLWVNPAGNGDNVLISINPGVSFQYEYKLPPDHPAGTFWYHTHRHGSTALQVSSGMAGALVVRGTRPPTPAANGDIDTLLRPTSAQRFPERLVVLQQIQYACRDAAGKIKTNADGSYKCDPGDVGGIEGYDQFGPGSWPTSGRYTTLNGLVVPTFGGVRAGQIERWRVIHGGVRDTINLQFRKLRSGAASFAALRASDQDAFVTANCTGDVVPQHLIAADGLTVAKAIRANVAVFQPAYRWDALMVFPQAGTYCVIDDAAPAAAGVGQDAQSRQLLAMVTVGSGRDVTGDVSGYLASELAKAAAVNMPANVKAKVTADLRKGLMLTSFVPHPDIRDDEVTGTQDLAFNIAFPPKGPPTFEVNGKPFDPDRVDRVLMLGGVDEWTLKSDFVSHPFHIHINPFQIVKILDPNGTDVSAPGAVDRADPQYPGLKGVWKDTLWVKNLGPPGKPTGQYTLVVRTRYQRYIGDYVLHCHILDHEDQGMMQRIRVALPDGAGGTSQGHH
jgi:L-ascorbate oxidase